MNRREMMAVSAALAATPWLSGADAPKDDRPLRTYDKSYFPFEVPKTLEEWKTRRERVREQILVANGLWPMPERTPLNAVIHGTIDRGDYTIQMVYFASRPGHYVTGNLYKKVGGSTDLVPGVLFAHGHWAKGRFMEADAKEIKAALESKGEGTEESAKYHMQALCATLARRGYVVFQYDMVGHADSTAIPHDAKAWNDVEAVLRLQSLMGLQTWNSLRALDFLCSVRGVHPQKIGMTGGSGGGTQTFIAAAIDDRIACAVPAVMVSTAMQGGCACENCCLLRVGTGNVEFAALMAPRPLALTGANDWTKEIMTKGYPELQSLYALYGKKENVLAKAWLEYGHNYNQKAREFMYSWFAKHLEGKDEEVVEPPFTPVPPKELSVFDKEHPRPVLEVKAEELRKKMTMSDDMWNLKRLPPSRDLNEQDALKYQANSEALMKERLELNSKALRVMLGDELPAKIVVREGPKSSKVDGCTVHRAWLGRPSEDDRLPTLGAFGAKFNGTKVTLWIHPEGKESLFKDNVLVPAARKLIDDGYAVVSADLYGIGSLKLNMPVLVDQKFAAFTFGYNRTILAQRVHDILTLMAFGNTMLKPTTMHLVGWGKAGPWAAIARAIAGNSIAKTTVNLQGFDFSKIEKMDDEMMLPGALKYGGMKGILPHPKTVPNTFVDMDAPPGEDKPWTAEQAVEWLMKPLPK